MLPLLIKYAEDHGLKPEPGFKPKQVRWGIVCDDSGGFLDVIELGDTESKANRGQWFETCPDLSQPEMKGGGETKSHFLVDTAEVAVLYGDSAGEKKNQAKHAYFVNLLRQSAAVMPKLAMAADCLDDGASLAAIAERLKAHKAKPTDKVTFCLGTRFPVESQAWHDWWRNFRRNLPLPAKQRHKRGVAGGDALSLVSGQMVVPARTHPKVDGLGDVGGNRQGGDALASYKQDSFCSYGLKQSANAPMSEEEAHAYRTAVNHLIRETGQRLAGAKVVHWFKEKVDPEDDPLSFLQESAEQKERDAQQWASKLLESIRTGKKANLAGNYYYALTLSGASGRVMVRDWMEGRFEDLVRSVKDWFSHLEIARLSKPGSAASPPMERVVTSLLLPKKPGQKYEDWIKPIGADRVHLWRAALRPKQPIPYSALARLVRVNAVFHQTGQLEEALKQRRGNTFAATLALLYTRMGLMKAYHFRKGDTSMSPGLNPQHPDPAYHCGRIMAVLAKLQRAALGDVGAGVVQRYYAAASSTPALVLGRLIRNSQFHLSALGKEKRGLAVWFENQLKDINERIEDCYPAVLDLERQSLFALGYYHQLAYRAPEEPTDTQLTEEENHD